MIQRSPQYFKAYYQHALAQTIFTIAGEEEPGKAAIEHLKPYFKQAQQILNAAGVRSQYRAMLTILQRKAQAHQLVELLPA